MHKDATTLEIGPNGFEVSGHARNFYDARMRVAQLHIELHAAGHRLSALIQEGHEPHSSLSDLTAHMMQSYEVPVELADQVEAEQATMCRLTDELLLAQALLDTLVFASEERRTHAIRGIGARYAV